MLLLRPIRHLATVIASLQQGRAAAESVFGRVDETGEPDSGTRGIARTKGRIELDSVVFRYRDDRPPALRNVSLVIEPGDLNGVVTGTEARKRVLATAVRQCLGVADSRELDGNTTETLILDRYRPHNARRTDVRAREVDGDGLPIG